MYVFLVTGTDTSPTRDRDAAAPAASYRPGYELVAEQILELIAELRLAPGDRMPTENELASRLGTSRTVVREAVSRLKSEGLVETRRGSGAKSATPTWAQRSMA